MHAVLHTTPHVWGLQLQHDHPAEVNRVGCEQDFMRLHEDMDEADADSVDGLSGAEPVGATCMDFCRVGRAPPFK